MAAQKPGQQQQLLLQHDSYNEAMGKNKFK